MKGTRLWALINWENIRVKIYHATEVNMCTGKKLYRAVAQRQYISQKENGE